MKYREGKVEYYGKKRISLVGAMEVQWVMNVNAAGESVRGFRYSFTSLKDMPDRTMCKLLRYSK